MSEDKIKKGCGKYYQPEDRICGDKYNWKDDNVMRLWICPICKARQDERQKCLAEVEKEQKNILNDKKWLEFRERKYKGKTRKFIVWSKCSNCYLGEIKWNPQWRHYSFFIELSKIDLVTDSLMFSDRCHLQIGYFIRKLNEEHKQKLKEMKNG